MGKYLSSIVDYLNENYSQDSSNYCIFRGAKPEVIKYDEHTVISFWACGAVVCRGSILSFIYEDDGNWFIAEEASEQSFSVGWSSSFRDALQRIEDYVKENGKPVYFEGIEEKVIAYYAI